MRSSGSVTARLLALVLVAAAAVTAAAQGSNPQRLFRETTAREATVRRQLDAPGAGLVAVLPRVRTLVGTYQDLARLFPASPIADDALWQGARLSADAFWQAGEPEDRTSALRLFTALTTSFPQSAFSRQVAAHMRRLDEARVVTPPPVASLPAPAAPVPAAEMPAAAPSPTILAATASPRSPAKAATAPPRPGPAARAARPTGVTLTGIRREVLPEALRITLDVEQETTFHAERLEAPARVFVDLKNTRAVDALKDAVLPYPDGVVRQVRIGRQTDQRTRVVFDLHGSPRHSVYTLYDPYRIVIDFEQAGGDSASTPSAPLTAAPPLTLTPALATAATVPLPSAALAAAPESDAVHAVAPARAAAAVPATASAPPTSRRVIAALDRADRSPHAPAGPVVATRPVASAAGAAAAPAVAAGAPEEHLADVPLAAAHAGSAVVAATPAVAALTTPSSPVAGARAATRPPNTNMRGGYSLSRQLGLGIARIVIDPGHGGHDPGAKVRGLTEADLVLDVALRLEALLAAQPGVEVVLTRRTNTYVSLEDRTDIANRADADIFLSIHANASANTRATGIESYFLNFAPNKAAEAAAARENAASGRAMRHLGDIVKAIALDNKRDESRDLATMIQAALHGQARRDHRDLRNLGVKQAPFMVLIGATMPSVLTEIAFITNQQELALLKKDTYRQHLAEGLLAGITRYQQSLKRAPAVAQN